MSIIYNYSINKSILSILSLLSSEGVLQMIFYNGFLIDNSIKQNFRILLNMKQNNFKK